MRPEQIIESIITRHEKGNSDPVHVFGDLNLHPMLNYRGLMARGAYRHMTPRKYWKKSRHYMHANRRYVGLLDFQIIDPLWVDEKGKMSHPTLLHNVLNLLTEKDVIEIYYGKGINELDLTEEQIPTAFNLMCAFIEQEVNWGPYDFQLHTHFGSTKFMYRAPEKCEYLQNAVPRDFFCSHILWLFDQFSSGEWEDIEALFSRFFKVNLGKTDSIRNAVIRPPIRNERVLPRHQRFMLSSHNRTSKRWIEPFVERISKLCLSVGPNHLWERYYEVGVSGDVLIKYECPTKELGEDWPIIEFR